MVVQVTGTNWPRLNFTLLMTGMCRFRVNQVLQGSPYPIATVTQLDLNIQEKIGQYKLGHSNSNNAS